MAPIVAARVEPPIDPFGWSTVATASALRTSTSPSPTPVSASGSTWTRTAGCCPPPTVTCPTPSICEIFCARIAFAASKTCASGTVLLVIERIIVGESAGLTFR